MAGSAGLLDAGLRETLERLARVAARTLDTRLAMVTLVDDRRVVVATADEAAGLAGDLAGEAAPRALCRLVIRTGRPVAVGNLSTSPLVRESGEPPPAGLASYLGTPILTAAGEMVGTLCVADDRVRRWSDDQRAVLADLAAAAASEFSLRVTLHRATERGRHDPLTGVLAPSAFTEALERAVARARHADAPLSLVLLALDGLEQVNRAWGHVVGDALLASVAERLRTTSRPVDVLGRVGGARFAWILPGMPPAGARPVAERARLAALEHGVPEIGHRTVSIGVAGLGRRAATPEALVAEAETALREARATGGNRVVTAGTLAGMVRAVPEREPPGDARLRLARTAAREQAALRRVAEAVAADAAPETVLELAAAEARRLSGARGAAVWRFDGDRAAHVTPGCDPEAFAGGMTAPIHVDGALWGALVLTPDAARGPVMHGRRLARFADLIGRGLTAALRREELAVRLAEHAALRRVATAVVAEENRETLFRLVAEQVAALLGVEAGFVAHFIGDDAFVVGSWYAADLAADCAVRAVPLDSDTALGRVHRTGRPARADYGDAVDPVAVDLSARGFGSSTAAPIHVAGRVWGAVVASTSTPAALRADAEDRLGEFAELLEMAIAGAEARELLVSQTMSEVFGAPLDLDGTLQRIAEAARRALGADRATCYVHDDDGLVVTQLFTTETDPARRRALHGAVGRGADGLPMWEPLVRSGDPIVAFPDVDAAPDLPRGLSRLLGARSVLMVRLEGGPLDQAGGPRRFLGSLAISYRRRRRFTERDLHAVRSLAALASLALAQARLHSETLDHLAAAEARAAQDPLTGLTNHRAFHERLNAEVGRAHRHGRRLTLALLDIDHFARVNRVHSHQVGDEVLREVARRLASVARPEDTLARVGGEEFAWILPECAALDAWEVCERAREAVGREPIGAVGRVTVSIGLCDLAQAGDAGELFRLAGGALYWAKEHGRDATFRYTPEVVRVLSAQERAEALQRDQALVGVRLLARAVDARDPATHDHSVRVADLAVRLARALGWGRKRAELLHEAALVHDVGKIAVPDRVLFKPDRLTPDEYAQITVHAELGALMVDEVFTAEQVAWVRGHHERVDGRGYPDGRRGDDIPEGARILAVADAFDVMTNARVYSSPMVPDDAVQECLRAAGEQFDRAVVDALVALHAAGELLPR